MSGAIQTNGSAGITALVEEIAANLEEHFPSDERERLMRQGLAIAEEAGEFVGALRRYLGAARRTSTLEEVEAELADLIITSHLAAYYLGIDLDAAISMKAAKILTRGWKDSR